jgi:RNA polymerase sigma-70 factor (ECF subfamily)
MVQPLSHPMQPRGEARRLGPRAVSEKSIPEVAARPVAPLTGPSDHDLIRAAQRGEEQGFADLVHRHEDRAVRVALSLIANREDARDLAQEAFLRVFRNLERFDFKHEFTTWLYRIVTNLAIDLLRKRRPAMSTSAEQDEEADLDLADPEGPAPSEAMEQMETAERVRACIERLAPHFRSVMILRELEGLPCTEIAGIVGTTHVTVRWRLHRGRKLFLEEWERMEREASAEPSRGAAKGPAPEKDTSLPASSNTPPEAP